MTRSATAKAIFRWGGGLGSTRCRNHPRRSRQFLMGTFAWIDALPKPPASIQAIFRRETFCLDRRAVKPARVGPSIVDGGFCLDRRAAETTRVDLSNFPGPPR